MAVALQLVGAETARKAFGGLSDSVRLAGGTEVEIGSTAPYTRHVIEGTRAHTIEPVVARALFWPGANHPVRRVRHPGTRPNRFIQETVARSAHELEARMAGALELAVTRPNDPASRQAVQLAANVLLGYLREAAPVKSGQLRDGLQTRVRRGAL